MSAARRLRLVRIGLVAGAIELGWLALWWLSAGLSQSPSFTGDFLAAYPSVGAVLAASPQLAGVPASVESSLGRPALIGPTLLLGAVLVYLSAMYAVALVILSRASSVIRGAVWLVLGSAALFQLTLVLMPGLFSQDLFGYIAYGRIATTYGLNPYVWPPNAIAKDPAIAWVASVWQTYACPYGPLWVDVQSAFALAFDRLPIVDQALVYRLVAGGLQLLNAGLVWRALGRLTPLTPQQRVAALAAFAWNPLLLFELAGDAHNDALMVSLSLLAVVLLLGTGPRSTRGQVLSGAAFTLGALVKYVSGIGLVWVAIAALGRARTVRDGVLRAALVCLVSVAIVVAVAVPWLELPDSFDPLLNETAGVGYVNSLPDHLALAVSGQVDLARAFERVVTLAAFGAYLLWEVRRVWTDPTPAGVVRATVRTSLVYVLLVSTSVQAWYFALPVSLAVLLGLRSALARVTIGYTLLALPTFYVSYYLRDLTPAGVWLIYGLVPLLGLVLFKPSTPNFQWLRPRAAAESRSRSRVAPG